MTTDIGLVMVVFLTSLLLNFAQSHSRSNPKELSLSVVKYKLVVIVKSQKKLDDVSLTIRYVMVPGSNVILIYRFLSDLSIDIRLHLILCFKIFCQ